MNIFKRLFKRTNATAQCPRCLGKGHVDMNDIKRLGNELRWAPGKCAYCSGTGLVEPEMLFNVAIGDPYLTINLPKTERNRVINGDGAAAERANLYNQNVNLIIAQILELYFVKKLEAEQIVDLYLQTNPSGNIQHKNEMIEYVNKVIAHSGRKRK